MMPYVLCTLCIVYVLGALGALRIQVDIVNADPREMPGGGPWVLVLRAFLWPLIVVLAVITAVVIGVNEL